MEFISINKVMAGRFINRYDALYRTSEGHDKTYEFVSRSGDITTQEQLFNHDSDAVVMFLTDPEGERLLLEREFRMATGQAVFNCPAGLINPGETPEAAAARELREETGLELCITKLFPPGYSAVGISNEKNTYMFGTAKGEMAPSDSDEEEIQCLWVSRPQALELVETQPFETRTQLLTWLWATGKI